MPQIALGLPDWTPASTWQAPVLEQPEDGRVLTSFSTKMRGSFQEWPRERASRPSVILADRAVLSRHSHRLEGHSLRSLSKSSSGVPPQGRPCPSGCASLACKSCPERPAQRHAVWHKGGSGNLSALLARPRTSGGLRSRDRDGAAGGRGDPGRQRRADGGAGRRIDTWSMATTWFATAAATNDDLARLRERAHG